MFNTEELKDIKYQQNIKIDNRIVTVKIVEDWKITKMVYQNVEVYSKTLDLKIKIQDHNLFEIMETTVVENRNIKEKLMVISFKGKYFLLKENSREAKIAIKNAEKPKLRLAIGGRFKLEIKNSSYLKNLDLKEVADIVKESDTYTFVGSYNLPLLDYSYSYSYGSTVKIRDAYVEQRNIFYNENIKEYLILNDRKNFRIIEDLYSVDGKFQDKIKNASKLNLIMLSKVKEDLEKKVKNQRFAVSPNKKTTLLAYKNIKESNVFKKFAEVFEENNLELIKS